MSSGPTPNSLLSRAVDRGNIAAANEAILAGGDTNFIDRSRSSLVATAATSSRPDYPHEGMLDVLLTNGADINGRDTNFATPLIRSIGLSNLKPVERLLARGADPNLMNVHGYTPLTTVVADFIRTKRLCASTPVSSLRGVLSVLQSSGADIDVGFTALMFAAQHGSVKLLKIFAPRTKNIDTTFYAGRTALHFAAANGFAGAVKYLLSQGSSPCIVDSAGATPIDLARAYVQFFHPYGFAHLCRSEYDQVVLALESAG